MAETLIPGDEVQLTVPETPAAEINDTAEIPATIRRLVVTSGLSMDAILGYFANRGIDPRENGWRALLGL